MYIAFKWLTGLTTAMWMGMCCIDMYLRKNNESGTGLIFQSPYRNFTSERPPSQNIDNFKPRNSYPQQYIAVLHGIMFIAGAMAVLLFNKKSDIMTYTKKKMAKIKIGALVMDIKHRFKTYLLIYGTIAADMLKTHIKIFSNQLKKLFYNLKTKRDKNERKLNSMLLKKLVELGDERQSMNRLLISAIHENKSIRMQYQLETMAKNRLLRYIDDTQKKIKENRSKYVTFQHLYLVTHQENIFLKARVRKLVAEKEEAENKLLRLINEVYKSRNRELKSYCSQLIVQSKEDLLHTDMRAEIQKFLRKCRLPKGTNNSDSFRMNESKCWTRCSLITEIQNDSAMPLVSDAPKLKGLPGEYVWTVKDKNDIAEKLYENDYDPELDNGDTIKRIRQYSVYFDKDCLLDYTTAYTSESNTALYPVASRRLVTGSEAFQKFLKENDNIVHSPIQETDLIC